jgi:sugar lactone lactonase YvrE
MVHRRFVLAGGLAVLSSHVALAQNPNRPRETGREQALVPAAKPPPFRLEEAARFDHQVTGVAVSSDGRIFVNFPRWTEDCPVSVAEVARDGSLKPYPDEAWNAWRNARTPTPSPGEHFVCVQSVVCDNRGNLWVLDPASPGLDKVVPGGPKLVCIELATNKVAQVIRFGEDVALQGSYLNDVRFHPNGTTAFITDSGARGSIVVVDLEKGHSFARLDGHPSTQPEKGVEVSVAGEKLKRPDGRPFQVAADGIALSNDGHTLYWQALTGRTLYRVETAALTADDPEEAARRIEKVGTTHIADGLLMSRDDRLYLTSPEDNAVHTWTGERSETVLSDPRLSWPDSLAEGPDGSIYVTASRIHEMPWFRTGAPNVLPTSLFRMVRT